MTAIDESVVALELCGYLPRLHVSGLAERGFVPSPSHRAMRGAVLFADIAGFSAQTETLGKSGPRGAEELSMLLDSYFGSLTDCIESWGGDVIVFAGDAVLAMWPAHRDEDLEQAVEYGAACALELEKLLHGLLLPGGHRFAARVSLAAGAIDCYQVGGIGGRWFYCVGGEAIAKVVEADGSSRPGVLRAAADVARLAPRLGTTEVDGALAVITSPCDAPPGEIRLAPTPLQHLTPFVPAAVHARHLARQTQFLGEFRTMTLVFCGFEPPTSEPGLLQDIVGFVQTSVEALAGELYQVLVDDKGLVAVAAFGMPMRSHENDAERAVRSAVSIRGEMLARNIRGSIGVATGRLFCGSYGGSHRRQYSIIGTTINKAARLMQAAETIYVDETTRSAARGLAYLEPRALSLKGFEGRHLVYVPTGHVAPDKPSERIELVGRSGQLRSIAAALTTVTPGQGMAHILIEAEAGMGKSTLLNACLSAARDAPIGFLRSETSAIDHGAPYFAFRRIFRALPGLSASDDLVELANSAGIDAEVLPLLNGIAPLGLPETDVIRAMTSSMRAENTLRVLVELLRHACRSRPLVLVLEDVHWMDSASWQLCQIIARRVPSIGLLMTGRPGEEVTVEWEQIGAIGRGQRFELSGLSRTDVAQLIAQQIRADGIPAELINAVFERCEGNPFHARQLVMALLESGHIQTENGVCFLRNERPLDELALPDSVQGLVTERFDQLNATMQTTLKVASVIGFSFDVAALAAIHPLEPDREALRSQLAGLCERDLIHSDVVDEVERFSFAHAITHGSIYSLLPYSQRRTLNSAAASWLAEAMRDDLTSVRPRLAHHYLEADQFVSASEALRASGRDALNTYANKEAMRFLMRALTLDSGGQAVLGSVERADTRFSLMLAHYGLGNHAQTRAVCQQVLEEAGYARLRGVSGLPRQLAQLVWQGARAWLTGSRARPLSGQRRDLCVYVMRALSEVTAALSFQGYVWEYVQASLELYNLGARSGQTPESAIGRVGYGYLLSRFGVRRKAERELSVALEECQTFGGPSQEVVALTMLAFHLLDNGRLPDAVERCRQATRLAEQLGSGLWRHRAMFGEAESLIRMARYEEGCNRFDEAISAHYDAEPASIGLPLAMKGIGLLRRGLLEEARDILLVGVRDSELSTGALPRFLSLGALAEVSQSLGQHRQAVDYALQTLELAAKVGGANSFAVGMHGYAGAARVLLDQWGRTERGKDAVLSAHAARGLAQAACKGLAAMARAFPANWPRYAIYEGLRQHRLGHTRRAQRYWAKAAVRARETSQPYDRGLASVVRGQYLAGPARDLLLEEARSIFVEHHAADELNRLELIS